MIQRRMSFWHLPRSQLQYGYNPDTEFILLLIQISTSDTVQIRSRHGFHSATHSELIPNTQLLHIQMFLCYPSGIQIHSRHDSHSDIHSKFKYSYNSDTLQTRTPFFCSYRLSLQIQFKCIPNTDTILMLILLTYNIAVQQTFLDGIFKPISSKILPSLNGIFHPIPAVTIWRVQIYGHSSVQSSFTFESRKANLPI